jgi:hypothetical protein
MPSFGQFLFLATTAVALGVRGNNHKHVTIAEVVGQCKQDQVISCCTNSKKCHAVDIGATNESDLWSKHCNNRAACCSAETNLHNAIVIGEEIVNECNILTF